MTDGGNVDLQLVSALRNDLTEHAAALAAAVGQLSSQLDMLAAIAACLLAAIRGGQMILVAGNGGSAAEAQHFSAELVGRFRRERRGYPAIALTTDTSILTAVANDYSFRDVFARQVEALGRPGDVLCLYSTSGESENLLQAAESAHRLGMQVVAITGSQPSRLARTADLPLLAPGPDTAAVQEVHLVITHLICEVVERELSAREAVG